MKGQYAEQCSALKDTVESGVSIKESPQVPSNDGKVADYSDIKHPAVTKKKFLRASGSLLLAEIVPWTIDRYVRQMDYAVISTQTLSHNINPGSWTWDGDGFITNQFGHPYHGSLFFNSFRSNGYNFWQSSIATFTGSLIWEIAAENQEPAPNDLINTTFGGVVMGEMTHRLANRIINNNARGFKRQASEVIAFIINPMNGLSRIIDGKWGRVNSNTIERDSSKLFSEIDAGLRKFTVNSREGNFGMYGRVKLIYGAPYENYKTPFSNIYINFEFGKDDSAFINNVNIYGSIKGWHTYANKNLQQLLVLTANYDYIHNQAFFYSAQSVKLNVNTDFTLINGITLNTIIGGGPIILASVPDPYMFKGRFYDYCAGVGYMLGGKISISNTISAGINYRGGWLKTINGHASHYLLHAFTSEFRVNIKKGVSLVAEPGYFSLRGNYPGRRDITRVYPFLKVAARYSFNIK
jgi:hypothetical protein